MPSQTPNLLLYKKDLQTDGQDTFNIQTMLNDNWDKLDTAVGGKVDKVSGKGLSTNDYSAADKTKLDGATSAATAARLVMRDTNGRAKVAAPSAADDIARKDTVDNAVQPLAADLADAAPATLTLVPGQQAVTVTRDTPLRVKGIKGRTLLNQLGRDGNCESLSKWSLSSVSISLDSSRLLAGNYSIKGTSPNASGTMLVRLQAKQPVNPAKCYIFVADIYNSSAASVNLRVMNSALTTAIKTGTTIATQNAWVTHVVKLAPSDLTGHSEVALDVVAPYASTGANFNMDTVRFYEITQTEYDALASMTAAQIAAKYPYVDDIKNVNGVYVRSVAGLVVDDQYVYYPDCQLAASLDGTVYDELYTDNTGSARATRRFKSMDLTGDLAWFFGGSVVSGTGYKGVQVPIVGKMDSAIVSKYDGKILSYRATGAGFTGGDQQTFTDAYLFLSVPSSDSGWGDSYTPSVDEIKAYFNGWKMYPSSDSTAVSAYNGTGTKAWSYRSLNGGYTGGTTVPPTTSVGYDNAWRPYRLQYQLATPTDEPVRSEGAIMLAEGANTLEVGYGAVVRERANPYIVGAQYNVVINSTYTGPPDESSSKLAYRSARMIGLYRNGKEDRTWKLETSYAYGQQRYNTLAVNYDPSAVYEVTYLALDTYLIGIPPTQISAEYATNQRSVSDELAKAATQLAGRVTVLENGTAQNKQPQWIAPTLLNGWTNYGINNNELAGYSIDNSGVVRLRGLLVPGTIADGTVLFNLPVGYRPKKQMSFAVTAHSSPNYVVGIVTVVADGRVAVNISGTSWLGINSVSFRID